MKDHVTGSLGCRFSGLKPLAGGTFAWVAQARWPFSSYLAWQAALSWLAWIPRLPRESQTWSVWVSVGSGHCTLTHGQTHWLLQRDQQLQLPAQVLALSKAAAGPGACKQLLWLAPANAVVPRSLKTPGTTGPKKGSHSSGLGSSQVRAPRGTTVRFSSLPATWKAKGYVSALCCSSFSSAIQQVPSSCPATKNSDKWRASKMKRSFVEQQSSSQ